MAAVQAALAIIAAIKAVPRWQHEAEVRLAKNMAGLFDNAAAAVLRELARRGVPSSDVARTVILKPVIDAEQMLLDFAGDGAQEAAIHARNAAIDNLRKQGIPVGTVEPLSDAVMRNIRDKVFEASGRTMARIRGNVMDNLVQSYADGKGIEDAARALAEEFVNIRDFELERIARTEIHGAQSDQAHATVREYAQFKQWVTADDDRVRGNDPDDEADHASLHEVIVRVDDPFPNGLQYPGDRNGPIGEWINCRCREVPFIMPRGYMAPPGKTAFLPSEVVPTGQE